MAGTPDHTTTIVSIAGTSKKELVILANLSPPDADPEAIWSVVANLSHGDEFEWDVIYEVEAWLTGLSRSPGGRLFAVSMDGELHFTQAANWTVRDLGCPDGLNAVWALADDDVFAAGQRGERVRIQGNTVTVVRDEQGRTLNSIHGSAAGDIYAVGDDGVVFHFDGKRWVELPSPTNYTLFVVLGRAKNEVYVAGSDGILYRFDGVDWEKLICPDITITSLAWYRDTLYATAGEDGVWRLTPDGLEKVKDLSLYELQPIKNLLYGVGGTLVAQFNGKAWTGGHLGI